MDKQELKTLRTAVANYMRSEGCGCCRNVRAHEENEKVLAKLLRVPMYKDKSGYNFSKYEGKING